MFIENCQADLTTAAIQGTNLYFGNAASPAHVYHLVASQSCPEDCNSHGTCVQGSCVCTARWTGPSCSAPVQCPRNCSNAGQCIGGVCHCNLRRGGADCSITERCSQMCQHGSCRGANSTWPCVCESNAWSGPYCSERRVACPNDCSNHGTCREGLCSCDTGFMGDDCGIVDGTVIRCAFDTDCGDGQACDSGFCRDVEAEPESQISPTLIAVAVIGAAAVGLIGLVTIFKSWKGGSSPYGGGMVTDLAGPSKLQPGAGGGYVRLPKRLVK